MATLDEVRGVLAVSPLPIALIAELLNDAPELWLDGESPDVIAGDVAFCHPHLGAGEVRVRIVPAQVPGALRVSVLAEDRPGLLAATAGVLTAARVSVVQAVAMTWPHRRWALQRVLVADPAVGSTRAVERDVIRARLRTAARSVIEPVGSFVPSGEAHVDVQKCGRGRSLIRVTAPDRLGLLWAISSWLERQGCNIVVARATPLGKLAVDVFLVAGEPDAVNLAARLTGAVPAES